MITSTAYVSKHIALYDYSHILTIISDILEDEPINKIRINA